MEYMKIVILCNLPPPAGGAEIFSRDLAACLPALGLEVVVITQRILKLKLREANASISYPYCPQEQQALYDLGIEIRTRLDEVMRPATLDARAALLVALLAEIKPDIIHCHMPTGMLREALSAGESLGIPVVTTMHGMTNLVPRFDSFYGPEWSPEIILGLMRRASHNVVVSQPMLDYCRDKKLSNVSMIPGGLRTGYFSPAPGGKRRGIIYVGKLNRYKGVRQAVSGYLRIAGKTQDCLYLVGRGITAEFFEKTGFFLTEGQQDRVSELIAIRKIILVGEVLPSELLDLYRRCRVMVLPSLTEGLPISILEALSCGLPVVASNVGSIPDVVRNGHNGFLIRPGNISEYSSALLELLDGYEDSIQQKCRDSVSRYGIGQVAKQYARLFKNVAKKEKSIPSPPVSRA
jgi:glycosyltransferase involved in cell wall biosynthesis